MIEKMYGPEVFYDDAANQLIPEAYGKVFDEEDLESFHSQRLISYRLKKANHLFLQLRWH